MSVHSKRSFILHITRKARAPLRDTRKKRQRNISGSMSPSSSDVRVVEATNAPAFEFGHAAGITIAKVLSPSNFKNNSTSTPASEGEKSVHVATCGNDGYVVVRDLITKETIAQLSSSSSSKEKTLNEEEQKPINGIATFEGKYIAIASDDHSVKLFTKEEGGEEGVAAAAVAIF